MKNKGFIKVVEAVVASVIVLASLTYFFGYYVKPSEWSNAQIKLQSQDILNAIDSSNYLENFMKNGDSAADELQSVMENMISERVGFALDITGAPPPLVKIGCVKCDGSDDSISEEASLRNRVNPFDTGGEMRGRNIRFSIDKKTVEDIANNPKDFDIMFIYGYPAGGFTTDEINKIKQYLESDGNVILFGENTNDLEGIFDFSSDIDSARLQYYYSDISGGGGLPGIDTSGNGYSEGRAVWVDHYVNPPDTPNAQGNNLLKSVIMWTAEDFPIFPEPVFTLTLPKTFFRTFYSVSTVDNNFNMYKVGLTLWYIF